MTRIWLVLVLLLCLAAGLRIPTLEAKCLWLDEVLSWRLQSFPISLMLERTGGSATVHPPLYFAALHAWTRCLGESHVALRSLAAAAGVLTVATMFFLARDASRFSAPDPRDPAAPVRAGLVAAVLAALSPFQIYLSQQVRGYTLGMLFFALSSWFLLRALHGSGRSSRRFWVAYAFSALAFCYTHNLAIFSITAQGVFAFLYLWGPGSRQRLCSETIASEPSPAPFEKELPAVPRKTPCLAKVQRGWAMVAALILILGYLPWLPRTLGQSKSLSTSWVRTLSVHDLAREPYSALLGTPDARFASIDGVAWAVVLVLLAVLAYLAFWGGWGGAYVVLAGLIPTLLILLYSAYSIRSIFDARYLAFVQPAWLVALALAVSRIPARDERWLAIGVLVLWSINGCYESWGEIGPSGKPGMRAASQYIMAHRSQGEPVVAQTSAEFLKLTYYLRSVQPVLCVTSPDRNQQFCAAHLYDDDLQTLDRILAGNPRGLWVVSSDSYRHFQPAEVVLSDKWQQKDEQSFDQDVYWERPIFVRHFVRH